MPDVDQTLTELAEKRRDARRQAGARAWSELEAALNGGTNAIGIAGVSGGARAWLVSRLARSTGQPVLVVVPEEDDADALAHDLTLFLGADQDEATPKVLRIPADDVLPYDDLSPSRDLAIERLKSLFHLRLGTKVQAIVLAANALGRRVIPRAAVDAKGVLLAVDQDHDLDALKRVLVEAGYEHVPLVEDPGTFAVRGGIVDIYSPLYSRPARLEFFGDTIETIRFFETDTQRTTTEVKELAVCPAREVLFDERTKAAATQVIRATADEVHRPSAKVRELLDEVDQGIPAFGLEALLPGFWPDGLDRLIDYLPAKSLLLLDDPLEVQRKLDSLDGDLADGFRAAIERAELALPPVKHQLPAEEVVQWIEGRRRIEIPSIVLDSYVPTAVNPDERRSTEADLSAIPGTLRRHASEVGSARVVARFAYEPTTDIRKEILAHHGEEGALSPFTRRLGEWRSEGLATLVACAGHASADKLKRMLQDRDVPVRLVAELPADPASLYVPQQWAHLVVGELSSGFVGHADGFVVVADHDVLGDKVERKVRKPRAEQPFVAAFRDLKEGDLVVHVDHGIARYDGLTKLKTSGFEADFLILQFHGKDKLYLPVHRLRSVQKYVGGDPEKVRLDSLQSQSFQQRKARVKEELLRMAAGLLDLYAARRAHPGHKFHAPDALYRQFEADFEFEETVDQQKAIDDVLADMQKPVPMDRLVCGDVGFGKTEVAMRATFKAVEDKKQVAVLVPTTVLAAQHFHSFKKRMQDFGVVVEMVSRFRDAKENKEVLKRLAAGAVDVVIGTHRLLSTDVHFKDLGLIIIDEEHRFGVKHKEALKRFRKLVDVLVLTATPIPRTLNLSLAGMRDLSVITTPPADRRAIRTFVVKYDDAVVKEAIEREIGRGGQVYFLHNRVDGIEALRDHLQELVPHAKIAVGHGQMGEGELEEVMTGFVEKKFDVLLCTTIIESGLDIASANTMLVNNADAFGLAQLYQIRGRVGRSRERAYCYLFVPARRGISKDAKKRLQVLQEFTELGAGFHVASHDMEIRGAGNLLGPDQSGSVNAVGFDLYAEMLDEAVRELRGEAPREEAEPDVTLAVPAFLPDDYVPDVQQRLVLYKRLAQARNDDELRDVREEMVDRYGDPPDEADQLCQLMTLQQEMRRLKLRALESGPGRLVVTLGQDAKLDPLRLAQAVARSKEGLRLTPDMKLVYPLPTAKPGEPPPSILDAAHKMLRALAAIRQG